MVQRAILCVFLRISLETRRLLFEAVCRCEDWSLSRNFLDKVRTETVAPSAGEGALLQKTTPSDLLVFEEERSDDS